jgi:hypothetical protein
MKQIFLGLAAMATLISRPAVAQDNAAPRVADYVVGTAQPPGGRPLFGVVRKADFVAFQVSFISDTRDGNARKEEVFGMISAALAKAKAAGYEIATGSFVLIPVTLNNYREIPLQWAGREDTSKADLYIKMPLTGSIAETEKSVKSFIGQLSGKGRGTIQKGGGRLLAIRNPELYRASIIAMIAEDAKANAAIFGPDYRASVEGLDKAVAWNKANEDVTDVNVFLYVPYSYRIFAR